MPIKQPQLFGEQLFLGAGLHAGIGLLLHGAGRRGTKCGKLSVFQMSKDGVIGSTFSHLPDAVNRGFGDSLTEDAF